MGIIIFIAVVMLNARKLDLNLVNKRYSTPYDLLINYVQKTKEVFSLQRKMNSP